jgi:phosphatidylethanolamine/phosphatidyl-N-methylethanolamine N-methyltransferase
MIHRMHHRLRDCDEFRFFLHWLRRPGQVGAVVPSGPALAAALADEIDTAAPGAVVELGPGTGRVTRALLKAGVEPGQLVAIERDASFCEMLRERFPAVRIVSGEARKLELLLRQVGAGPVKAVVSSLPLLNMTSEYRRAVLSQIAAVLPDEGLLVQYTYGMAAPVPPDLGAELGVIGKRTTWILANLPPAAVWRYRRNCPAPSLSQAA